MVDALARCCCRASVRGCTTGKVLAPLLAFHSREQLEQLLVLPFALLKRRGHQADLALAELTAGLWQELTRLWGHGERFSIEHLQALVHVTFLWERCGGAEVLGAFPSGNPTLWSIAMISSSS